MTVYLEDTDAGSVGLTIGRERFAQGSSAVGRVLTLVVVAEEATQADSVRAAVRAAREHPCRILVAISCPGREAARLDASVTVGGSDGLGEIVELRMRGPLARHAESVVLPLLVPDTPVVVWWPAAAPDIPSADPIGALATRRITDCGALPRPVAALQKRVNGYTPGDTDLAWTRLTPWRSLLAALLDTPYPPLTEVHVHAERSNPSARLLAAWLHHSLGLPVTTHVSKGPGITEVVLVAAKDRVTVSRPDGRVAMVDRPQSTRREAALPRRSLEELIAEELRRLDADDIYEQTLAALEQVQLAKRTTP